MADHPIIQGLWLHADKQVEEREFAGLRDFQLCVGGLIEAVELSDGSTLYVNEEGRIYDLPFNSVASDVAGLGGQPSVMLMTVKGDAVLVGPLDAEGYDTDVSALGRSWVERVHREAVL